MLAGRKPSIGYDVILDKAVFRRRNRLNWNRWMIPTGVWWAWLRLSTSSNEDSDTTKINRRLVAVFAADVEGYSRLMGADEVGTLKGLTERRAILDRIIGDQRGRINSPVYFTI
jgi:hypothetical protein